MQRRTILRSIAAWSLSVTAALASAVAVTLTVAWLTTGGDLIRPPDGGSFASAEPTPSNSGNAAAPDPMSTPVAKLTTAGSPSPTVAPAVSPSPTHTPNPDEPLRLGSRSLPPVDRGAALPEDRPVRARPTGLQTSSIDVARFPVREIGLDADGALEIPDATEIGWYRYGATAGDSGSTVMAAHVTWNGQVGPFFELGALDAGAQIEVRLDDGSARWYEVTERAIYAKDELPPERIWRNTGPEELVLITCGGDFNPEIRSYRHNVVVYAVPVD